RLAVLGTFAGLFVIAVGQIGGVVLAFAAVLVGATLALAWALGGPVPRRTAVPLRRGLAYGLAALLVAAVAWRLALSPVLADTWHLPAQPRHPGRGRPLPRAPGRPDRRHRRLPRCGRPRPGQPGGRHRPGARGAGRRPPGRGGGHAPGSPGHPPGAPCRRRAG